MNSSEIETWRVLWKPCDYVDWKDDEKKFAVNVYNNNRIYVEENWQNIREDLIQEMFMIAVTTNNTDDQSVFTFLNKIWTIDKNYSERYGDNCLTRACTLNHCIEMIRFLIKDIGFDKNYMDGHGNNCLRRACMNANTNVIKLLINEFKMDPGVKNKGGVNCLMGACLNGYSLEIIKLLVSHTKNLNDVDNDGANCLDLAIEYISGIQENDITGIDVIRFLIIDVKLKFSANNLNLYTTDEFYKIVSHIPDYETINQMILCRFKRYGREELRHIVEKINPFKLWNSIKSIFDINPFDNTYDECTRFIDELDHRVESCDKFVKTCNTKNNINRIEECDFTKPFIKLFIHGGNPFFGYKDIVISSMHLFHDIEEFVDGDIILEGNLPKDVINKYISSSYTGLFCIDCIPEEYFLDFLKFIDQYPTKYCSIDILEQQMIKYIDENKIKYNEYLKGICDKYQLKSMYLDIHNKNFELL